MIKRNMDTCSLLKNAALFFSLCGFFVFFSPPLQFSFGAAGVILSLAAVRASASKKAAARDVICISLGVINMVLGLFVFANFIAMIRLMDDPDSLISKISDPEAASEIKSLISQYKELLSQMKSGQ